MRPKQQAQDEFLIFQNENQFNPLKQNWLKISHGAFQQTNEAVCFQGGAFAHASGLQMTPFQAGQGHVRMARLHSASGRRYPRGRFDASLPGWPLLEWTNINAHTADYISDGCLGSKHDSANRRHSRRFVTFQMFSPPPTVNSVTSSAI